MGKKRIVKAMSCIMLAFAMIAAVFTPKSVWAEEANSVGSAAVNIAMQDLTRDNEKAVKKGSTATIYAYPQLGSDVSCLQGLHCYIKPDRDVQTDKGESVTIEQAEEDERWRDYGEKADGRECIFLEQYGTNPVKNTVITNIFKITVTNIQEDIGFSVVPIGPHSYLKKTSDSVAYSVPVSRISASKGYIEIKAITVKLDTSKAPESIGVRPMADVDVVQGEKMTDPGAPRATKPTGYNFAGWFTKPDADPSKTADKWNFNDPVEEEMTLYALYTPVEDVPYRIEYVGPNGEELKKPEKGTGIFGEDVDATAPTIEGYEPVKKTDSITLNSMDEDDNVLTFNYTAKTNINYTVHYYIEGTKTEVADDLEKSDGVFNTKVPLTAPDVTGYSVVGTGKYSLLLDKDNLEYTFFYTANKSSYTIQRFLANTDGKYPASTSNKTTYTTYEDGKDVLVGQNVKLTKMTEKDSRETAGINLEEYTYDEEASNVVSGPVETSGLVLKLYFKRATHKVSFDTSKGPQGKDTVTTDVPAQEVPFGKELEDPGTPEASDDDEYNFDGWYNGNDPWDFNTDTMPSTDITLTPHWSKKVVTITFTEPKYIMRREKLDVTQLMFTVTIDGKTVNRANYDSYNADQKKILDSVKFTVENIAGFDAATNPKLANLVVGTIADGGSVTPGKSGVAEVTAHYMGTDSTNTAIIIVPGDMNADGVVNVSDASICASYVRNVATIDDKTYTKDLGDMNADGFLTVADCTIMCQMLRGTADYNNSYLTE